MEYVLALHILEEEQSEIILKYMQMRNRKRRAVHLMYKNRSEEGTFNNLITRHLIDDEEKFRSFFRLNRNQFNYVLQAIKENITKKPTSFVRRPISPEEKLAVTLR